MTNSKAQTSTTRRRELPHSQDSRGRHQVVNKQRAQATCFQLYTILENANKYTATESRLMVA